MAMAIFLAGCNTGGRVADGLKSKFEGSKEIQVDYRGNFYSVEGTRQLRKYNSEGQLLYEYTHPEYAGISDVDVSDPHKVVLFYKDQQKAVILDRSLAFLSVLDLNRLEKSYAVLFRRSEEEFYWLFDINAQKLISVDEDLTVLNEGFPLYQEGIQNFYPEMIGVGLEWIVLGDPDQGILIFDHFATYRKKIPIKGFESLLTFQEGIYFSVGGKSYFYNPAEFEPRELIKKESSVDSYYAWDLVRQKLQFIDKTGEQLRIVWEAKF
jgi:hypothetical protein